MQRRRQHAPRTTGSVRAKVGGAGLVHMHALDAAQPPDAEVAQRYRLLCVEQPGGAIGDENLARLGVPDEVRGHVDRHPEEGATPPGRLSGLDREFDRQWRVRMPKIVPLQRIRDLDRRRDRFAGGREHQVESIADVIGLGGPSRQGGPDDPLVRSEDLEDPALAAFREHA